MPEYNDFTPEEWGRPLPKAKPVDVMGQPRGEALFPLPHPAQFAGQAGWANRAYWGQHDEALANSRDNAEKMRLDPVIDSSMRLLTYPTSLLTHHVEPDDDEDPKQVEAATRAQKYLSYMPGFLFAKHHLYDEGSFTGRAAVKMRWQNKQKRDRVVMLPTGFEPINGDKLVFKYDGRVGCLVQSWFPAPTEAVPAGNGRAYFFTPEEREQLIVFNFEPTDASYYKPQRGGAIQGLGFRDKLYWIWALKMRVWSMGMDFLQWFAQGLTVYYFRNGNAEHARAVQAYVEAQQGQSAMLFPYFTGNETQFKPIERFEASTASPAFIQQLLTDYFDRVMKEIILGQSLTSGTAPTGLGSGVAAAHQNTFDQRVKYLASAMDEVMTRDILGPYYRANEPGMPCGRWVSDLDDPNAQSVIENAERIVAMGGAVPEETVLEAGGLPQVKPGDTILTNVQPQQPAATGGIPNDVPVQEPLQLSRRQYEGVKKAAAMGDRRCQRLLLHRRITVR